MKVVVALSGGVDSSVALYLLKEAGHDVTALFMKNWDDKDDPHCPATQDYEDALMVADRLNVPLYAFNFAQDYWDRVFTQFLADLQKGYTPNPDILCNREIKFQVLLEKAQELGGDFIATGHYACIENGLLKRGLDPNKDQSYFLYAIDRKALASTLFPIGHFNKPDVRKIAESQGLITHNKRDSTGICFIGKRNFRDFIATYLPPTQGVFSTPEGKIVGHHSGAWFYTIGQRKGLGIGGPGEPWFVIDKNIQTHTVTVVQGDDHPDLWQQTLYAQELNWLLANAPSLPLKCSAKIRYRSVDQPCTLYQHDEHTLKIEFDSPVRAVTPGQSIVFYQGEICLGGGCILPIKKTLYVEA